MLLRTRSNPRNRLILVTPCSRLPHTLLRPEDGIECCIFAHDPSTEFKQKLAAAPVPGFTKVIGVGKLKTHYKQYKERRELADAYDLCVCASRV